MVSLTLTRMFPFVLSVAKPSPCSPDMAPHVPVRPERSEAKSKDALMSRLSGGSLKDGADQ